MTSSSLAGTRRRRLAAAISIAALVLLFATGCSLDDIPNQISIPDPGTEEGERIFHLWQATWIALWVVGALTWGLILGAAVVYRRRKGDGMPAQKRYNIPIEVMYTVTPLIVVAVFTIFTWRDTAEVVDVQDDQYLTVNVVGYQWNWGFNYLEPEVYQAGSPNDRPTLYLPSGERVQFVLTSPDVIHSFWIPEFLMKMDVVPGRENTFEVTPTTLGRFAGRCAEMCGTYHSQMLFWVEVVEPEVFEDKMAELEAAGQTGALQTDRQSDDAQNQGNTELGGQPADELSEESIDETEDDTELGG